MNKKIVSLLVLFGVLAIVLMTSNTVPVQATTDIDMTWSGSGTVIGNVTVEDDMFAKFATSGSSISGSWYVQSTPADYHGADPTISDFSASFAGGGVIIYDEWRTDSYYGVGDEYIGSMVISNGTGSIRQKVYTSWAHLYALTDPSTNLFTATGNYFAGHRIDNGANYGSWSASGLGTMGISERVDTANYYGSTDWTLGGAGAGCWGNAIAVFTGSGTFGLNAYSGNSMYGNGWSSAGPITYTESWNFTSGLTVNDFHLGGN